LTRKRYAKPTGRQRIFTGRNWQSKRVHIDDFYGEIRPKDREEGVTRTMEDFRGEEIDALLAKATALFAEKKG
jgi:hypothetical protein